jgi:hypothetical protein
MFMKVQPFFFPPHFCDFMFIDNIVLYIVVGQLDLK